MANALGVRGGEFNGFRGEELLLSYGAEAKAVIYFHIARVRERLEVQRGISIAGFKNDTVSAELASGTAPAPGASAGKGV